MFTVSERKSWKYLIHTHCCECFKRKNLILNYIVKFITVYSKRKGLNLKFLKSVLFLPIINKKDRRANF